MLVGFSMLLGLKPCHTTGSNSMPLGVVLLTFVAANSVQTLKAGSPLHSCDSGWGGCVVIALFLEPVLARGMVMKAHVCAYRTMRAPPSCLLAGCQPQLVARGAYCTMRAPPSCLLAGCQPQLAARGAYCTMRAPPSHLSGCCTGHNCLLICILPAACRLTTLTQVHLEQSTLLGPHSLPAQSVRCPFSTVICTRGCHWISRLLRLK
jgi:hypothetical protein